MKKPLSIKEHKEAGKKFKDIISALMELEIFLSGSDSYLKTIDKIEKVRARIEEIRSYMDDRVYHQFPKSNHEDLKEIYY